MSPYQQQETYGGAFRFVYERNDTRYFYITVYVVVLFFIKDADTMLSWGR